MALNGHSVAGARWAVTWLGKRGYVQKKFSVDFGQALRTYDLLRDAGKKNVTLRCTNVGFPPPVAAELMGRYNARGWFWCVYCIKFRRFSPGVSEAGHPILVCPVCDASTNDFHIRMYNPKAKTIEFRRRRRGTRVRSRTK